MISLKIKLMNIKLILRIVSYILFLEVALMIPAAFVSVLYHELHALTAFGITCLLILAIALILYLTTKNAKGNHFYSREGLVTTGVAWIVMSILGCLPFVISGEIPSFVDALFETVSGFTTTGSSIVPNVEMMSKGILWWRSFTHWIGGMGVLVFLMAIVSLGGRNGGYTMHIMRAESPGPSSGKIVPRMKETAKITYLMYMGLTAIDTLLLITIGRMPVFDAFCIAFGTAGTGGFGVKADSMASYSHAAINITTVFMLLFSVNFGIYFMFFTKRIKEALKDEELKFFWGIVIGAIACIFVVILPMYGKWNDALRDAAFNVATIISTTGYATADFNLWPVAAQTILVVLMCFGACAGSTGGGMKSSRVLILLKAARRNIHAFIRPSGVRVIRYNERRLDESIVNNVLAYLAIYVLIILVSTFIISFDNFDFTTNLTAVLATFNNIGPGLNVVGPTGNFAGFSILSKCILIFDMLAGRLEIMPILVLFSKSTWMKAR